MLALCRPHGKSSYCKTTIRRAVKFVITFSKIDPNSMTEDGFSPLHLAVKKENLDLMKILLKEYHADINVYHKKHGTPLHCATKEGKQKIVAYLLLEKANDHIDRKSVV